MSNKADSDYNKTYLRIIIIYSDTFGTNVLNKSSMYICV